MKNPVSGGKPARFKIRMGKSLHLATKKIGADAVTYMEKYTAAMV